MEPQINAEIATKEIQRFHFRVELNFVRGIERKGEISVPQHVSNEVENISVEAEG